MRFFSFFLFFFFFVSFSLALRGACSLVRFFSPRTRMHSLERNSIGAEGARAVAEALKSNVTLTALVCVSLPLTGCALRRLTFVSVCFYIIATSSSA